MVRNDSLAFRNRAASFSSRLRCALAAAAAAFNAACLCGTLPYNSCANRRAVSSAGAPAACRDVYNASGDDAFFAIIKLYE